VGPQSNNTDVNLRLLRRARNSMPSKRRLRQFLSIANEVVRFWQHIICPLLLLLFSCGRGGKPEACPCRPQGFAAERS
jgi:hypothetical protein